MTETSPATGVPESPVLRRTGRHRTELTVGVVIAVAGALLIPTAFGAGLLLHRECQVVSTAGSEAIWTPAAIVNAPPNGSARGWANGSVMGPLSGNSIALDNGSSGLLEVDLNWTVLRLGEVWAIGPGLPTSCLETFAVSAEPLTLKDHLVWCTLQSSPSASDIGLNASLPVEGCSFLGTNQSARFSDTYAVACPGAYGTPVPCPSNLVAVTPIYPGIGLYITISITGFSIEIPIPSDPHGDWLPVGDPISQTEKYGLSRGACYQYEALGPLADVIESPPHANDGPLAWGPAKPLDSCLPPP